MDAGPTPYVRPVFGHLVGTALTKDDRVLYVTSPSELADRRTWVAVRGINLPTSFAVQELVAANGEPDGVATHAVEYEFWVPPERDTARLRSVLVTGLGEYVPTSDDFRALRPEDNRARALEYFERADWASSVIPGWDYGGSAPAASTFPSTRSATHHDLQKVADIYMANLEQKPAEAVQDALGVSRSTADRRIREARKAGLITATAARGRKPQS